MTIGERIRSRRTEIGLSQDLLAKKMGYRSRSTIAKIESGENDISQTKLHTFAKVLDCSVSYLMGTGERTKIPVLGKVAAGIPLSAIREVLDYEEIPPKMASSGDFFALQIKGDSMEPRICSGDVAIIRCQPDVENGEIAVVLIGNQDAICKKVAKHDAGISLISLNPAYEPLFFTNEEIQSLPVTIMGKMVELRGKF